MKFEKLIPTHSAPIISVDACVKKPLFVTASKDKSIRIWNYHGILILCYSLL
mgnify:CR=1 FL=1